jgi:hypothetical protein
MVVRSRTVAVDEASTGRPADRAVRQDIVPLRHQLSAQRRSHSRARPDVGWQQGRAMITDPRWAADLARRH